jgi:hypothetical protein
MHRFRSAGVTACLHDLLLLPYRFFLGLCTAYVCITALAAMHKRRTVVSRLALALEGGAQVSHFLTFLRLYRHAHDDPNSLLMHRTVVSRLVTALEGERLRGCLATAQAVLEAPHACA